MDKKIYVIIPVYNAEHCLQECIDSVKNQTYTNWEMILVDDGSTDRSGKICDENARVDRRIRVIHQKNSGSTEARNTGVASITDIENTYCFFCDSDDVITNVALQIIYEIAEKHSCDIVYGQFTKFLKLQKPQEKKYPAQANNLRLYEGREIFDKVYCACFGYGNVSVSLASKLFRTEIVKEAFNSIKTWPHFFGDDLNATIRIIPLSKRIAIIDNIIYFYRYGGGTNKFMKSFIDDCVLMYHTKKEYAAKYEMNPYFLTLIDVEMKNLALHYLVMCIRTKTYPHGKLSDEISFLFNIPEFHDAVSAITDDVLEKDYSEIPGFTPAFKAEDVDTLEKIAKKKAGEKKLVRFLKSIL